MGIKDYKTGLTGNIYYKSTSREDIVIICLELGKSINSIYFNKKYKVWTIRVKSKNLKSFIRYNGQVVPNSLANDL